MTDITAYVTANELHRILASEGPYPTIEAALGVARNHVQRITTDALKQSVLTDLYNMYDMHVMMYGELPEKARLFQVEPWIEPLEEQLETYFAPREKTVTMDWLGTLDARAPKTRDDVLRLAESYAKVAYEVLTWYYDHDEQAGRPKTAAQILSAVGIVRSDLEGYVNASAPNPEPTKGTHPMVDTATLITELHTNATALGLTGNNLADTLDNACDEDAGLGVSGLTGFMVMADVPAKHAALVALKKQYGLPALITMVVSGVVPLGAPAVAAPPPAAAPVDLSAFGGAPAPAATPAALDLSAFAGGAPAAPVVQTGDAPAPKGKAKKAATATAGDESGLVPGPLLAAIRDGTGAKGEELGALVGTSRATFDNYCKGKGKLYVTDVIKQRLLEHVNKHRAMLDEAAAQLEML